MTVAIWEQRDDLTLPPTPSRMHANENRERNMPREKWGPFPTLPTSPQLAPKIPSDHSVSMHVSRSKGGHHNEESQDEEDDTEGQKQWKCKEINARSGWVEVGSSILRLLTEMGSNGQTTSETVNFPQTVTWNKQKQWLGARGLKVWINDLRAQDVLALGRLDQLYFIPTFNNQD